MVLKTKYKRKLVLKVMQRSYRQLSSEISYYNPDLSKIIVLENNDSLQTYFNNNLKVTKLLKTNTGSILFNLKRRGS